MQGWRISQEVSGKSCRGGSGGGGGSGNGRNMSARARAGERVYRTVTRFRCPRVSPVTSPRDYRPLLLSTRHASRRAPRAEAPCRGGACVARRCPRSTRVQHPTLVEPFSSSLMLLFTNRRDCSIRRDHCDTLIDIWGLVRKNICSLAQIFDLIDDMSLYIVCISQYLLLVSSCGRQNCFYFSLFAPTYITLESIIIIK